MVVDIRCEKLQHDYLISLPDYFKKGWLGGTTLKNAYHNMKEYRQSSGVLREMLDNGEVSKDDYILAAEQIFLYGRAGRRLWIECAQNYISFKLSHMEPNDATQMFIEIEDRLEAECIDNQIIGQSVENEMIKDEFAEKEDLIAHANKFDKKHIWMFDAGLVGRRSFSGNPKYLFIYINKYRPDICAYWICEKDSASVAEQVENNGFYACVIGTVTADRMIGKTGVIVSELLRESYLGGTFNTKYLNLWHGIGFKRIERGIINDNSDLRVGIAKKYISYNNYLQKNQMAVVTSKLYEKEFQEDLGLDEKQLIRAGYLRCLYQQNYESICTYNHEVINGKTIGNYDSIAVYVPTYRAIRGNAFSTGIENLESLHMVCEEKNMLLIFKMHPQIENEVGYINAKQQYGAAKYFLFWDNANDFYEIINQIDLVIYDYSSMFSDFLCAGVKHFIRYIYDEDEYMKDGFTQGKDAYYERTCGVVCHSFEELLEQIEHYEEFDDSAEIEKMYQKLWGYAGDNDFEKTIQAVMDFEPDEIEYPTLYSYDIFDTLISRKGLHPYSIFYAVRDRMKKSREFSDDFVNRYPQIRHSAEMNVREYYKKTTQIRQSEKVEIKFDEIFDRLADVYNLTTEQKKFLKEWEIEEEINSVVPLTDMIQEVKQHLRNNDTVVFISDMYLPKEAIQKMIEKADPILGEVPLFVSSEYGYQKTSRLLYFEVYRSFKPYYRFGKWIHCGDTPAADKAPARKLGIETRLINRNILNTIEEELVKVLDNYSGYLVAAMASRLRNEMNFKFCKADFVIDIVAMTLVPYVDWVIRDAIKKGFEILYFVARDGYPLKLIADAIIKENDWKIETKYLYASRRTWRIQSYIDKVDDIFWIQQGGSFNDIHSKEELFKALMIDEETFREIVPQLDLDNIDWSQNQPGLKIASILQSSDKLNEYLLNVAAEKREISCKYLLQEFDKNKKFACVEYWGRGYNQECMTRLWNYVIGEEQETYYYYARTILPTEGLNVRYNITDLNVNVAVMEAIFANMPYKSIEDYEEKEGHIYPIINENKLCEMSLYNAMNAILPEFAKRYAQLEISDWMECDRKIFDYSIEYVQNNRLSPFIANNIGELCDSMSMHGEAVEYARAYTDADLEKFSNRVPRARGTQSIQMSYARSSEHVKNQYKAMYQIEEGDDPAGSFVLKPNEIKKNNEFKKKYEIASNRATKAKTYYEESCSKNHVYPKICIVSNSKDFDSDALKILNEQVKKQQKLYVEWVSANRPESNDAEMMELLSMAKVIIVDGNVQQLLMVRFRAETTSISLLDRGFRLYSFGRTENIRLKWQKRFDTLLNQRHVDLLESTSEGQKELSGFTADIGEIKVLEGACITDVLLDENYKVEAYDTLLSIVPEVKDKKIIFYMPQPRKRRNSGDWLELLDIEQLESKLSDEYFLLVDFRSNPVLAASCKNVIEIDGFSRNISKDKISLRQAMVCADIVIGDYRDTFFESALLHKPVYSTAVDMGSVQSESLNMMYDLENICPFPVVRSSDELVYEIKKDEYRYDKLDEFAGNYLRGCDGCSSDRLVEMITNI